ncbi:MAG: hypothetical protein HY360_16380 [Verrucomicrobia bacterium]|nr:hypothetical protein [Verrucomicrobiota bacterium]
MTTLIHRTVDIELNNVRVAWGDIVGPWRSAVRAEHVENLDINGLISRQALPDSDAAAVDLTDVRGASVRGCRAEPGTGTFLRVDGASTGIHDLGNDLSEIKQAQS